MENYISNTLKQQYKYKSFLPSKINKPYYLEDQKLLILLERATRHIGELNTFSTLVPDIDFFIGMHVTKEATDSSSIEGTKTNLDEALLPRNMITIERRDDWEEVQNYIIAMNWAIEELDTLPLSIRLLKGTHKKLISGVRGSNKQPGKIRSSQNWIGGSNLQDAFFIPPHHKDIIELLSDLEKFWHNETLEIPHLIKIAISHYQFETIHPFLDGNGRIGRLLITLYLVYFKLLDKPTLYLSQFFERNRASYYDSLTMVRKTNNIEQWLKFFLNGVIETSKASKQSFENIIKLKSEYEDIIENKISIKRQNLAHILLKKLFSKPTVSISAISEMLSVTYPTANTLAKEFVTSGLLRQNKPTERNRLFSLWEYIEIFKGDK